MDFLTVIFYALLAGVLLWAIRAMFFRRRERAEKGYPDAYSTLGGDGAPHYSRGNGDASDSGGGDGGDGGGGGGGGGDGS